MKSAVFITVRSDSSRLPNKAYLKILDKPTIEMVMIRARQVRNADSVIVCTTERSIDDQIVRIAEKCGVQYFRGDLEDKLNRWLGATRHFGVDYFVTMDGDDLLCDPELEEAGIAQLANTDVDFIEAPEGLICGSFTYGIRSSALEKVCSIKATDDTEMMWVYFKDTGLFKVAHLDVADPVFYDWNIRLTLDYEEDFTFFRTIFEHFNCINNDVPLRRIVNYLKENPEIVRINAARQKDYLENQKRKTKLVIKQI